MTKLAPGDRFPHVDAQAVDGNHLAIPEDLEDLRGVLVFYRGHW